VSRRRDEYTFKSNAVCTKTQGDAHARTRRKTRFQLIILLISYTMVILIYLPCLIMLINNNIGNRGNNNNNDNKVRCI